MIARRTHVALRLLRAAELAVQKAKFPESGTTIELIFDAIICAELAAQSFFSLYVVSLELSSRRLFRGLMTVCQYFMAEEAEFSFEDMRSASSDMAEPQANLKGALEKILDQRSHTSDEEMELREYLEDLLAQVDNVTEDFLGFELFEQFTFAARWCLTRSSPEWLARNAFWVGHLASQAVYILHYMKEVQFDIIQDSMEDLAMSLLSLEARCLLLKLAAHTSSSSDMAEGIRTLREVADHVEDICCAFGTEQYVTTLMVEVREAIQQATMALRRLRNLGLNEA